MAQCTIYWGIDIMDEITFANGAVYNCSYLATDGQGVLWLILDDLDMLETVRVLSNPEMTEEILWAGYRLVGYTNLTFIMVDQNGIKACLKGGHDERID